MYVSLGASVTADTTAPLGARTQSLQWLRSRYTMSMAEIKDSNERHLKFNE